MRYCLHVTSRALPGRDEDFCRWYDETHVHDVLALPGFESCERFVREPVGDGRPEYLAIYEVETDDPAALLRSLFEASSSMTLSDAIDPASPTFTFMRPI